MSATKVLVVDDAPAVVETLVKALQRLGVFANTIQTASSATSAWRAFEAHKPPMVFIDMDLAGEPGDEVALRILREAPSTKVIVMTGLSLDIPRVRAVVSAGAYAVLEKPLRLAKLREVLDLVDVEDKGLRRVA